MRANGEGRCPWVHEPTGTQCTRQLWHTGVHKPLITAERRPRTTISRAMLGGFEIRATLGEEITLFCLRCGNAGGGWYGQVEGWHAVSLAQILLRAELHNDFECGTSGED